jgi:hypothetical protein
MAKRGKNYYNIEWEKEFKWLCAVPDNKHMAKCNVCQSYFSIESSGKTNVQSHAKVSNPTVSLFFKTFINCFNNYRVRSTLLERTCRENRT